MKCVVRLEMSFTLFPTHPPPYTLILQHVLYSHCLRLALFVTYNKHV
jgi:hypothetical protein